VKFSTASRTDVSVLLSGERKRNVNRERRLHGHNPSVESLRRRFGEQRVDSGRDLLKRKAASGLGLGRCHTSSELIEQGHRGAWNCLSVGSRDDATDGGQLLLGQQWRGREKNHGGKSQSASGHAERLISHA
jgi:hypothetical protein